MIPLAQGGVNDITTLLKRRFPEDKIDTLKVLIDELRSATTGQPGYISGETLRRVDKSGEFLVISKWKSLADWKRWYERAERSVIQKKIDELLGTPTIYEIYEYE